MLSPGLCLSKGLDSLVELNGEALSGVFGIAHSDHTCSLRTNHLIPRHDMASQSSKSRWEEYTVSVNAEDIRLRLGLPVRPVLALPFAMPANTPDFSSYPPTSRPGGDLRFIQVNPVPPGNTPDKENIPPRHSAGWLKNPAYIGRSSVISRMTLSLCPVCSF